MDTLHHYEKNYYHELENRKYANSVAGILILIISALGSFMWSIATSTQITIPWLWWTFLMLLIISSALLIGGVFQVYKSFTGYTYEHVPLKKEFHDYHEIEVVDHYKVHSRDEWEKYAYDDFHKQLKILYAESIGINFSNNLKKSSHLVKAKRLVVSMMVPLLALAIIAYLNTRSISRLPSYISENKCHIEIMRCDEMTEPRNDNPAQAPTPPPDPAPPIQPERFGVQEAINKSQGSRSAPPPKPTPPSKDD